MTTEQLIEKMELMGACDDALLWIKDNKSKSPDQLWQECERGDWLEWLTVTLELDGAYLSQRQIALSQSHLWDMPKVVRQYLETGDESIRSAAESAARSAAESAARSAAESAARSAAESAARSAAESAARSAARSAAESAARSAAWSAAELAARSAARSAAELAARSAARSAALKKYADIIRQNVSLGEVLEALKK